MALIYCTIICLAPGLQASIVQEPDEIANSPYIHNGNYLVDKITQSIYSKDANTRTSILTKLGNDFIDRPEFEQRRILYRIKSNRLKKLYDKYYDSELFYTVSEDLLKVNYTSMLGHFVRMEYFDRRGQIEKASLEEKILKQLLVKVLDSGNGSALHPYVVATLAEAEEFLFINGYQILGQRLNWNPNHHMLDVFVKRDGEEDNKLLYFRPLSVQQLAQEVAKKMPMQEIYLRYYCFSELSRMDNAARAGFIMLMTEEGSTFYKPEYIEEILERSKDQNNLYIDIANAQYLLRQAENSETVLKKVELQNQAIDSLTAVAEQQHGEAYWLLYRQLSSMSQYKDKHELMSQLIRKAHKFGSAEASYQLARENEQKWRENANKEALEKAYKFYRDAFERGYLFAAQALVHITSNNKFTPQRQQLARDALDEAISLGDSLALVFKTKMHYEKNSWQQGDDEVGRFLLRKLEKVDHKSPYLVNEMAWIYATHSSMNQEDLNTALNLVAFAFREFQENQLDAAFLDTVANVLARTGDLCNAIVYQKKSIELASSWPSQAVARLEKVLNDYKNKYHATQKNKLNSDCYEPAFVGINRQFEKVKINYGDGYYLGNVESGEAKGKGMFFWDNGDFMSATYENGLAQGMGTYYWGKRSDWPNHIFHGLYQSGRPQGLGLYIWDNGDLYLGDYRDGQQMGKGVAIYSNGSRYDGEFQNGVQQGYGVYLDDEGMRFEGEVKGDLFYGQGGLTTPLGNHYQGDFVNNDYNGRGIFTWVSGSTYSGEFKDGKFHGKGICNFDGTPAPCRYNNGERLDKEKKGEH